MSTTIYTATEQFADFSKANVAQAQRIAALAIENAEKFLRLNLNAAKVVLANGAEGAAAVASVKDVQDLMALRAKYAETGVQTATAYTKGLYELSSEAQAQFTALAEEAWSTYTKDAAAWVEKASKSAPAGSGPLSTRSSRRSLLHRCVRPVPEGDEAVVSLADASVRAARQRGERQGCDKG